MISISRAAAVATIAAVILLGQAAVMLSRGTTSPVPSGSPAAVDKFTDVEGGYSLELVREMPESVSALAVVSDPSSDMLGKVFVGTKPVGGVYFLNIMAPGTPSAIDASVGDYPMFGHCEVSSLSVRDLDRDGVPELLATTSQVLQRGRPRLYIWSLSNPPVQRCMTRPDILSSWSHGIGFLDAPEEPSQSAFVTFCGHGEIIEYQLSHCTTESGFTEETLGWKKVAQLPHSGEWLQSCDVDEDGQVELCVATGYEPGQAAIHIFASDRPGADLRREQLIDEEGRYCNVRFVVGDTRGDGRIDLVAWWCLDQDGGGSEIIRYRLGPDGIRERTVLAHSNREIFWPCDGQIALMDLDGNGHPELWFANTAGGLWCYDETHSPPLKRIAQVVGGFGPIVPCPATPHSPLALLVGLGRSVLRLVKLPARPALPSHDVALRAE